MAKTPLTVRVKDAYKDGIVFYQEATSVPFLNFIDVYGPSGESIPNIQTVNSSNYNPNYRLLHFELISGWPLGYSVTGSNEFLYTDSPSISLANDDLAYTLETSAEASNGIYNGLAKITLIEKNYNTEGNTYISAKLFVTYLSLRIIVESTPNYTDYTGGSIIRNSNLLMDLGVAQNIKVTFNSVYQTIYTRVTGLPAGMRYTGSPDGFLSGFIGGAPLASGTYNVTISISYKTSETSETLNTSKTIVYTVNEPSDPAILLEDQNLTSGVSVNLKLRASDVSAILAWSATGLPAGLVCGTGVSAAITGTPTTAGTYNSTISLSCRKLSSSETITVTKPVTFTIS